MTVRVAVPVLWRTPQLAMSEPEHFFLQGMEGGLEWVKCKGRGAFQKELTSLAKGRMG